MRPPQPGHEKTVVGLACPSGRAAARSSARLVCPHRPDYADGEQCRNFIYVKDCAAVTLWLLQSTMDCGIYNVSCGVPPIIEYVETPPAIRQSYQYFTKAVVGKLRAAGYTASFYFTPFETAVSDFVTEYRVR